MTPRQAYDLLEGLPPIEIKNRLLKALGWQVKYAKSLYGAAWYFHKIAYGFKPRQRSRRRESAPEGIGSVLKTLIRQ